ncbi:MAG: hypothetical protein IKG23_05470 [Clostridia bacterium]|nr:hypothetical protein [Clostridia bacterium]
MDKEKVIKGLEHCIRESEHIDDNPCDGCPYFVSDQYGCERTQMEKDALALLKEDCHNCKLECLLQKYDELKEKCDKLLKEQEAVVAHWDDDTGHWIEGDRDGIDRHTRTTGEMIDTFRCSWCGFYQYWKTPFCPNCGAKMESR